MLQEIGTLGAALHESLNQLVFYKCFQWGMFQKIGDSSEKRKDGRMEDERPGDPSFHPSNLPTPKSVKRFLVRLLGRIAQVQGHILKGFNLEAQINQLAEKGMVPAEIASDLHWVRVQANRARHNIEKATLTVDDAETALNRALRIVEGFYCEYQQGPRLSTIYAAGLEQPVTFTQMLETFLQAQQATEEAKRRLEAELEGIRVQQAAADQRRREQFRERIVGPMPSAVVQYFKDRVPEMRSLRERLADENLRTLLVCGRAGMGKTALITKLLHDL